MAKGRLGTPASTVEALPAGLSNTEAYLKRQEDYWARRGGKVTVSQLTPEEIEVRKAQARARRRRTSPDGLRARTRVVEKISGDVSPAAENPPGK